MSLLKELREERVKKFNILKEANMEAYPALSLRDRDIASLRADFASLLSSQKTFTIAGRVMRLRLQGGLAFFDLFDGTGTVQALLKKDAVDEKLFALFVNAVDMGDFVEVAGVAFVTKRGETTVFGSSWRMLAKATLPLPDKWHGFEDPEEKLRKRYLDLALSQESRDLFVKKAKFWDATRAFLKNSGFLEVETPTLEFTTGGAEARPFKTHHNDYDADVYLRISVGELWQKRLMAGGFPKTFEIGRVYRNEGTSADHLQEFTNMEFYWSYADYNDAMALVEKMYKKIAVETFDATAFATRGHSFDLNGAWPKLSYVEEVKKQTSVDVLSATEDELKKKLEELGVRYAGENRERLTDSLWKHCRKNISGPAFVIRIPKLVSPLAKSCADDPRVTERFQILIAGSEVGNGFSELNDPVEQRARFEEQRKLLDAGDEEAMMPDYEFVEMLEHGMPPSAGFGFGERLFAFLADKPVRETQLFPLVKPKE